MKKNKILALYLIVIIVIFLSGVVYMNYYIGSPIFPEKIEKVIEFTRIIDMDKEKLFNTMAEVKNYPNIFPDNVLSVNIINQSENIIFASETLSEAGITTNVLAKHTIIPYEKHIVSIMDGNAQNTNVTITFEEIGSSTKLTTKIEMSLRGILIPFGILPQNQFENAMETVIFGFVDYAKKNPCNTEQNLSQN